MEVLPLIEHYLSVYHIPAVFAGSFFFGESVVVTSAYLASRLGWFMPTVFLAAFFGTVISDGVWFLLGNVLNNYFARTGWLKRQREAAASILAKLTGRRPFIVLVYIKFIYGSRIAMILYLAGRRVSMTKFLLYDSLGTVIWLCVMMPAGYLAARGTDLLWFIDRIEISALVLLAVIIFIRFTTSWLTEKITKR